MMSIIDPRGSPFDYHRKRNPSKMICIAIIDSYVI